MPAALYLDTSCFLKVFFPEGETPRTLALIAAEASVLVTSLTRLETLSQVHARLAGGSLSPARAKSLLGRIESVLDMEPYARVDCPANVFDIAQTQIKPLTKSVYCRTLDRLHLAAMQSLGATRLLTNDDTQAAAARSLGFDVLMPR